MKEEEHWVIALVGGLRLVCLLVMGMALFFALLPKAAAAPAGGDQAAGLFDPWARETGQTQGADLPRTLVPVGHTVGIKLFSDGVLVVGLSPVDTPNGAAAPAKNCGLREGDIITHINSQEVDTIEEVQSILEETSGQAVSLTCLRDGDPLQLTTQAVQCSSDGSYKLGAWIRDSMAGIGTVTFVDPETGLFGALGHAINDVDTGQLMPLSAGAILHSSVTGVQKGQAGQPGQLRGAFDLSADVGSLYANTPSGVFGTLDGGERDLAQGPAMAVARREEVHTGDVVIRSNIQGDEVREYAAKIVRVYPENPEDTRNFLLKVTDPQLLAQTGGIVQGMSGSPILQDGKLIGAVTHVLVNDPTQGYGIFVENMLKAADAAA